MGKPETGVVCTGNVCDAVCTGDFRDALPCTVHALLVRHGFNERKILNFKYALRSQDVDRIDQLKQVKGVGLLAGKLPLKRIRPAAEVKDPEGNRKFVFVTQDGLPIESVLMPGKKSTSVCISTQAGCRMGCRFCHTAKTGFVRNLLPHEMLEQVRYIYLRHVHPHHLGCVTFMGMGEPFDNLANCRTAFDWIRSDWGWMVGSKRITFSTSGAGSWAEFFAFPVLPNLAVSLHSARPEVRRFLMPGARPGLVELRSRMLYYAARANKQVSIEYCLLRGVNDSPADAEALTEYLRGLPCKINLLNYNPAPVRPSTFDRFEPVAVEELLRFRDALRCAGFPALHRRSLGIEIGAGCGQLGFQGARRHDDPSRVP